MIPMPEDEEYHDYTRRFFARWAPVYDVMELFASGVREKVADIAGNGEGRSALDVATGTGKQAFAFARRGFDVTGVDLSEDMLRVAQKKNRFPNARFEPADANRLPFGDGRFDLACISFALHDMPPPVRAGALAEMLRVTGPAGSIIIVDYALPEASVLRALSFRFIRAYESRYYPGFVGTDLGALVRAAGIEIETERRLLLGNALVLVGRAPRPGIRAGGDGPDQSAKTVMKIT